MNLKEKKELEQKTLAWQHTVDCAIAQTNPAELDGEPKNAIVSFIQQHLDGAEDAEKVYHSRVVAVTIDNSPRNPVGSVSKSFEKKRILAEVLDFFFLIVFFGWSTDIIAIMFMGLCVLFHLNMNCIKEMQSVASHAGTMWKTIMGVQLDAAEKQIKMAETLNVMETFFLEFFHTKKTRKAIAVWEDRKKAARRDRAADVALVCAAVLVAIYAVDMLVAFIQFIGEKI